MSTASASLLSSPALLPVPLTSLHDFFVNYYHVCLPICICVSVYMYVEPIESVSCAHVCPGLTTWDQATCAGALPRKESPSHRRHCSPITCHP